MTSSRSIAANESCLSATRALCSICGVTTDAKVVCRNDKIYLVKWCQQHGLSEVLICDDASWYHSSQRYIKPGTSPKQRFSQEHNSCGDSCGLCPQHQQHTCVPIVEITSRCDLSCPICLVRDRQGQDLTLQQFKQILQSLVEAEGEINMLNLSGGEPTLHPEFLQMLDAALSRPEIGIVSVSTNGLQLAKYPDLAKQLRDKGVVISLQFDGLSPSTWQKLRGRADLAELKQNLVQTLIDLEAQMSLTVTLAKNLNELEVEPILQLLFAHDNIMSAMFQPLCIMPHAQEALTGSGRLTIPEVVQILADRSRGVLKTQDFTPLPCSHPNCFALTYLLKTEEQQDNPHGLVSLPSLVEMDSYLDIVKNNALLNTDMETLARIRDALYDLWSASGQIPHRQPVLRTVKNILKDINDLRGKESHRDMLELGSRHVKSIFIHDFMDRETFDWTRAIKCCNHYPQADGRLLPACVRNNVL